MTDKKYTENQVYELSRKAYEKGCADFPTDYRKCALIVIDMQDEFVKPNWTPYWVPEATRQVPRIKKLIDFCRKRNIPVIFTAFANTYKYLDRPSTGKYMPNRYDRDIETDWFQEGKIWHELEPSEQDIIILKPSYGAFYDTPLETILKNLGKDTVIICGTLTNFCCSTTARQAYERGFKVIFGSDVNSSDIVELHQMELKVLRKGFAKVISSDEIMMELSADKDKSFSDAGL